MVHEINVLAKALIKSEKKHVKLSESFKAKSKEMKRIIRNSEKELKA